MHLTNHRGVDVIRTPTAPEILTVSVQMNELMARARRIAAGGAKVLITGESGVGKDVLARHIHAHSARRGREYVAVNCAGVADSLLESELFGHVKGSFTGAHRDKLGKLQLADRGTLFLDELGEMTPRMQGLLLRFLDSGEIQAVGADIARTTVNVRVIAATNRNLPELVATGAFREDLLYRVRVAHLQVPPLRQRPADVEALGRHFLAQSGRQVVLTDAAWGALTRYPWPGNVRELQNVMEQLTWLCSENQCLDVADLPEEVLGDAKVIIPQPERRQQHADVLFESIVQGTYTFWDYIHPMFLERDITRHDLRELVGRGLAISRGSYRGLLDVFGIEAADYKRFMNFLSTHDCRPDYRKFRSARTLEPGKRVSIATLLQPSQRAERERPRRDTDAEASKGTAADDT